MCGLMEVTWPGQQTSHSRGKLSHPGKPSSASGTAWCGLRIAPPCGSIRKMCGKTEGIKLWRWPREVVEHFPIPGIVPNPWMWHLGPWFSGEHGGAELMVELDGLGGLSQLQQFHDSMSKGQFAPEGGWPRWGFSCQGIVWNSLDRSPVPGQLLRCPPAAHGCLGLRNSSCVGIP